MTKGGGPKILFNTKYEIMNPPVTPGCVFHVGSFDIYKYKYKIIILESVG